MRLPPLGQAWLGHLCWFRGWGSEHRGHTGEGAEHLADRCPYCQHLGHCENLLAVETFSTHLFRENRRIEGPKRGASSAVTDTATDVAVLPILEAGSGLRNLAEMRNVPVE